MRDEANTPNETNTNNRSTPLLDRVTFPADLRTLEEKQLRQFADELRQETIDAVSHHGWSPGRGAWCR